MGLLKTSARVAVASSVHGRVQRRQQQRWAAQDAAQAASTVAATSVGAPAATLQPPVDASAVVTAEPVAQDPMIGQLRQLAELRDAGILTEEEFSAKKAKILGI